MSDAAWKAIVAAICADITSGRYKVDDQVPTYRQSAADFGVSMAPVRKAYGLLESSGVLVGRPGVGVFVRRVPTAADQPEPPLAEQVRQLRREFVTLRDRIEDLVGMLPGWPPAG